MDPKVLKMMQGASGASSGGWEILAYTAYPKKARTFDQHSPNWTQGYQDSSIWANNSNHTVTGGAFNPSTYACDRFGRIGRGEFQAHTESDSGAASRTEAGDGDGLYSAAYNKTGLTKVALVGNDGTVDLTDPTNSSNYLVYDLVGTSGNTTDADAGTGTYTLISLLQALSAYNRSQASWSGDGGSPSYPNNQLFNGPNCRNFTSGGSQSNATEAGYSGLLSASAGKMRNITSGTDGTGNNKIDTTYYPRFFCFWGINLDSDHDTQVCCAFGSASNGGFNSLGRPNNMGSLSTQTAALKSDSFRGADVIYSNWSLWGNDWHSDTQKQNISGKSDADGAGANDFGGSSLDLPGVGGSGQLAYQYAMQSWPGTVTPPGAVATGYDPNSYMCQQVYFLGFSE